MRKQDKAPGSQAPRRIHICPRCGQFRATAQGVPKRVRFAALASQDGEKPEIKGKTQAFHG